MSPHSNGRSRRVWWNWLSAKNKTVFFRRGAIYSRRTVSLDMCHASECVCVCVYASATYCGGGSKHNTHTMSPSVMMVSAIGFVYTYEDFAPFVPARR